MTARARVFTVPAGIAFARALAAGVVAQTGADPLRLADALILVPTRRAVRSLREAFADALGGAALIPRIRALGDVGEDDEAWEAADDLADVPPIHPLRRRLKLAQLVEAWGRAGGNPYTFAQAMNHAGELTQFLDEAVTKGADLAALTSLAPDLFAEHWKAVATFLGMLSEVWPPILAAEGCAEPAAWRDARLNALAERLAANPPASPVIAAGSTGSIPATAELLRVIAHLPTGAVVLPGLDTHLDARSWAELDAAHAQFGLRELVTHIGTEREDVALWPHLPAERAGRVARVHFLSEALRPPPTTDFWRDLVETPGQLADALENFALIEAASPREEGLAIAVALREALETPGRTAALVTPDRGLARRVAAELTRWDIAVDDSAGRALSRTPPGAFLALLARAADQNFAPVPLLALLKHPLAAGGLKPARFRTLVRRLEHAALRGLRPDPGLDGLAARLEAKSAPDTLRDWFAGLQSILAPLADTIHAKNMMLGALARIHGLAAERLAATDAESGAHVLWRGDAGEAAATVISELTREGADIALADAGEYAELFRDLAELRAVRPRYNRYPRLAVLGPLEARLQDFDLVILGGLNEGVWPAEAQTDPWLSRPMRAKIGLDPPERRLGLAAHDFAGLAASRAVILTRSLKENGAPTVPSRWLLRIRQLARGLGIESQLGARQDVLDGARALDAAPRETRATRPSPHPPVTARPRALRVTEIETWLRDPYAIYARHVLNLDPLDPLDQKAGPAERGTAIHRALEKFLAEYPLHLPDHALTRLLEIGEGAFREMGASVAILALWRPRFERAARWFLDYERARRARLERTITETDGRLEIAGPRGPFTLIGRADRIDLWPDGSASILDYKTGQVPSTKQIEKLLAPQLPLEAAMLLTGAFVDLKPRTVRELVHVQLKGGETPGKECIAKIDPEALAAEARAKLEGFVRAYDSQARGYTSRRMPFKTTDHGDYDHLARVAEWSRETDGLS
jgi:ATP-dependent helicase/nuclease subunit B